MTATKQPPTPKKPPVDWESIEREYRAGQLSVVEIGRQHGVSHTAINKRAKKHSWSRDLSAEVRRQVSARLVSPEVSPEVSFANAKEAVETAAARGVEVVRQHRRDISEKRDLVRGLVAELRQASDGRADLEEAIEDETADDKDARRRNSMLRAVSLASRAGIIRDLTASAKTLIDLERQAFSLNEPGEGASAEVVLIEGANVRERLAGRIASIASRGGAGEGSK